jgi:hypothetical protein
MANGSMTRVAGGNITPCTFLTIDTSTGKVTTTGANGDIFGIATQLTRRTALSGWDDGYAAIDGEEVEIFCPPDDSALLAIAGTITPGQLIKSDASGKGVAATADKDRAGARAMVGGVSGDLIRVRPIRFDVSI